MMDCSTAPAHVSFNADSVCDTNSLKGDLDESKEAEGVWSQDIEKSFQEAMDLYPPCGRRKIVLSEEGKMYGRNELIARYIKMQTGKTRTRKQVSSHIQVLARRKAKELQSQIPEKVVREQVRQTLSNMSSAQIVSDSRINDRITDEIMTNNSTNIDLNLPTSNTQAITHQNSMTSLPLTPNDTAPLSNSFLFPHANFPTNNNQSTQLPSNHALQTLLWHHRQQQQQQQQLQQQNNQSHKYLTEQQKTFLHQHFLHQQLMHKNYNNTTNNNINALIPPHEQFSLVLFVFKSIATLKMRLVKLTVFSEINSCYNNNNSVSSDTPDKWYKRQHVFVHLHTSANNLSQSYLENINISEIWDCYPEQNGLREYFEKGPANAFFMVKFWIDIHIDLSPQWNQMSTIILEGVENVPIRLSTKLCSFGKEVLERIEEKYPVKTENGLYQYNLERVSMCEYMMKFIIKLIELKDCKLMNSVLENFTILMTISNIQNDEILLCIAYAMEVSQTNEGSQYHIYKLLSPTADTNNNNCKPNNDVQIKIESKMCSNLIGQSNELDNAHKSLPPPSVSSSSSSSVSNSSPLSSSLCKNAPINPDNNNDTNNCNKAIFCAPQFN